MEELNRRSFLRKTILGGTGALVTSSIFAHSNPNTTVQNNQPIIKRKLGKTGIVLPIVSYGVMRSDSPALLQAAFNEGIIYFDTAHSYQNGRNEEMIGEVFKDTPRDSIILSTKVKPEDMDRSGEIGSGTTSKASSLPESLMHVCSPPSPAMRQIAQVAPSHT